MLVQVQTEQFAFFGHSQNPHGVHCVHDDQGNSESGGRDASATDDLRDQHLRAAAVEQTL